MASRKEHMVNVNKTKAENCRKKILNLITGMFSHEYRKKNGNWNVAKIAKELGMSRNTVYKYIHDQKP